MDDITNSMDMNLSIVIIDSETGKETTLVSGGADTAPALEP